MTKIDVSVQSKLTVITCYIECFLDVASRTGLIWFCGAFRPTYHGLLGVNGLGDGDGGVHMSEVDLVGGVGDADGLGDTLHHRGDGGVSMALNGAVGEIAAETVGLDDGAVEAGGADEGGGGDDAAVDGGGSEEDAEGNEGLEKVLCVNDA